jgi:hypothetical protein
MVNSNGIAVDPKAKLYKLGGEVNTPPSYDINEQRIYLDSLIKRLKCTVNYRSNLHLHIRVPGLKDDLKMLKQIQKFITLHMPEVFSHVEPMWEANYMPMLGDSKFTPEVWLAGARRRLRRCRVSHHTIVSRPRVERQLKAESFEEFMAAECPIDKKGKVMWHLAPRAAVNLRQLMQTDTIEFRHFPGTINLVKLGHALEWCRNFLYAAMFTPHWTVDNLLANHERCRWDFPRWQHYCHWMEVRYRATVHDGTIPPEQITKNIYAILEERFDDLTGLPRER